MEKEEVYHIAEAAIKKLVEDRGSNAKFPFDAIWLYAERASEVPEQKKPIAAGHLKRKGFIEDTGAKTNAETGARKGSPTTEYKPGRNFRQAPENSTKSDSVSNALVDLEKAMEANGFIISAKDLANFYLGLLTNPIVIVAGLSGTGKSRLPRLFARFIGANFYPISVQPQWVDNADLFGYTSALNPERFVEGKLTKALSNAARDASMVNIVLLDEMNLASVEHYFSDFLSVVESRERDSVGNIITDPLPLDLPHQEPGPPDPYEQLRSAQVPPNVFVVGTANMDETTRMFSPKVLDRAFTIEFGDVDLTIFPTDSKSEVDTSSLSLLGQHLVDKDRPVSVTEVYSEATKLFDLVAGLLEEVRVILKPADISFGYRARDAILLYVWHWQHYGLAPLLPLSDALDMCVLQKVLPKIGGTGELLREVLETLKVWLDTPHDLEAQDSADGSESHTLGPFEKSAAKIEQMIYRLDNEGATTYWVH